jgi:dGTPase
MNISTPLDLAPYAVKDQNSKGRAFPENAPKDGRSQFARDRDRIIHSAAFRRLNGKTQVFTMASKKLQADKHSDFYRNRLTHSLEVSQVARSIARALRLNEDLCETLALAHDLGHAPFGHEGQDVLNKLMQPYGGFEHNIQSLRVVDALEKRYAKFEGLNLMFETREGLLKHCSVKNAKILGSIAQRHLDKKSATLEAQTTDIADAVAYTCHDIDDGIRSGLIKPSDLMVVPIFKKTWEAIQHKYPDESQNIQVQETLREILGIFVRAIIVQSQENIQQKNIQTLDDVRNAGELITLPPDLKEQHQLLKSNMFKVLYHHPRISEIREDVEGVLHTLFEAYMYEFDQIPEDGRQGITAKDAIEIRARVICDYISGMTDAFAYQESQRLEPLVKGYQFLSVINN